MKSFAVLALLAVVGGAGYYYYQTEGIDFNSGVSWEVEQEYMRFLAHNNKSHANSAEYKQRLALFAQRY